MEEPARRSLLDFVKARKRSETCRLVYIAQLHSSSEDILKAFSQIVKESFSESITGLLLAYPRHVIHLIEASEEDIFQLCSNFFKTHTQHLGSTRYFPVQTNVSCSFLDKWYARRATYHSDEENGEIGDILDDTFENVTVVHKETLCKLYQFYHELKNTKEENHTLLIEKLESLYEGGHDVLPNEGIVDFILNSQWGESLQSLTKSFFNPASPEYDEVWPFPEMALPRVDFSELDSTENVLEVAVN